MKKILLLSILGLAAASCGHFLDEENPTGITGVYASEELLESDVAGITLEHFFRQTALYRFGCASGIITWGYTGEGKFLQNDFVYSMKFTVLPSASENRNTFLGQYKIIQRANQILESLPESTVDAGYKLEIEAECRLYRAIAYFNLARYYGDVPLRLSTPTVENSSSLPCSPYYEVYAALVKDLEFALGNMRSPERAREISPRDFRPNRYAAAAYLSSVFTHIGSLLAHPSDNFWDSSKPGRTPDFTAIGVKNADDAYRLALKYAETVIPESPTHDSGCRYALVEKISDLYQFCPEFSRNGYTSWNNPEQIMVSSCSIESANTDYFTRNTVPNYCPGTKQEKSSDNTALTRPSRFLFEKWCATYPGAKGSGKFAEVHVSSSDPRLQATIWSGTLLLSNGTELVTYPKSTTISRAASMPYFRKYWSSRFVGSYGDSDYYNLRLGEIYLNAAEAAAFLGDETTARKYVEVLHARARHSVPDGEADSVQPSWEGRTFADKDELIEAIFWERMFELAGEGHEFTDTHRFGATWLSEVVAKPLNEFYNLEINKPLFGKHYAPDVPYLEDSGMLRKSLLCPIPTEEVNSNSQVDGVNDFEWGVN